MISEAQLVGGRQPQPLARRSALSAKGFRPFFLLAAIHVVVAIPLWLAVLAGHVDPASGFSTTLWHAHEMLFGFAVAVIAGFLLTAASNWTRRETATGGWLLGLSGAWLAGRVAMLAGAVVPPLAIALVDLAFIPLLAIAVGRVLLQTRNRRNYPLLGLLSLLFLSNLVMHLDVLGVLDGWARRGALAAVDLVIAVTVVMGGRVIPSFTRNASNAPGIENDAVLDIATALGVVLLAMIDLAGAPSVLVGPLAGATALAAIARIRHWGARHTLGVPMLWVLHVGNAWVVVGLMLRCAAWISPVVPSTAATHALTAGAIGTLTLGMMARVTRGHTGRMIVASRVTTAAFVAVTLAALVRVLSPIVLTASYDRGLVVAGVLFAVAFALFLVDCAPMLVMPRVDGKPG